jgi:hypothetical protein
MRIACKTGSHNPHGDMNDREPGAFHAQCMSCDMHVWIKEMVILESQEEDADRRILWFNPMSWLGQIRPHRKDESWSTSL